MAPIPTPIGPISGRPTKLGLGFRKYPSLLRPRLGDRPVMDYQITENERSQRLVALLQDTLGRQVEIISRLNYLLDRVAQLPAFYPPDDAQHMIDLRTLLRPMTPEGGNFVRVGGANDGGYVMVDHGLDNTSVYNFGIGSEVTWDQAMAERGNIIYQFDHTIDAPPPIVGETVFVRKGLGISSDDHFVSLGDALSANDHCNRRNLVLNIDIEGGEWEILPHLGSYELAPFAQIVMELHGLLRTIVDPEFRTLVHDSLSTLFVTHQLVHVHANNFGECAIASGVLAYDVLEVTLLRKPGWKFTECDETFPRVLDRPNNAHRPELRMGKWSQTNL